MNTVLAMQILMGVCGLVLVIVLLRQKMRFFLDLLLRAGLGAVVILWVNNLLVQMGIEIFVGLNFLSLLTSGALGFPGVALLFLISVIQNL